MREDKGQGRSKVRGGSRATKRRRKGSDARSPHRRPHRRDRCTARAQPNRLPLPRTATPSAPSLPLPQRRGSGDQRSGGRTASPLSADRKSVAAADSEPQESRGGAERTPKRRDRGGWQWRTTIDYALMKKEKKRDAAQKGRNRTAERKSTRKGGMHAPTVRAVRLDAGRGSTMVQTRDTGRGGRRVCCVFFFVLW